MLEYSPKHESVDVPEVDPETGATVTPLMGGDIPGESLVAVHQCYRRWFGDEYDLEALDCVLAAAAAEKLDGDPPWLLVVGGSGAAKTETIMPLTEAGAVSVSTINGEAALLSGTAKKDKAKHATGGLLRELGSHGLLLVKDFTSILSMNRDTRALVLAALREIYDGAWSRNVGSDGGQTIRWHGRLVLIGAVTTAWDAAHQVMATMGDRFLLVRLDSRNHRRAAGRQAMRNVSAETTMRAELGATVGKLLQAIDPDQDATLGDDEADRLLAVADLVTRARTAVERDFQGEPQFAHGLELPTRYAKQLAQIVRGALTLGMDRDSAFRRAMRCGADSIPPLRLAVLRDVDAHPDTPTAEAVKRTQLPRQTVDRTLRELHLLGLLTVDSQPWGETGRTRWVYSLAADVHMTDLNFHQVCHHP